MIKTTLTYHWMYRYNYYIKTTPLVSSNLPLMYIDTYYMIKTTPLVSINLPLDVHRYNYCMIKTTPLVSSNLPLDVQFTVMLSLIVLWNNKRKF